MPLQFTDEQLPFTPPPYYVPKKDLPRGRAKPYPTQGNIPEASSSRTVPSVIRRMSSRRGPTEGEGRVAKSQKKKKKPGLSINTNVIVPTRIPQEIKATQPVQRAAAPVFQPPPQLTNAPPPQYAEQEVHSHFSAATNSPSRFPSTYLATSTSRQSAQKTSPLPQDLFFAPPPRPSSSVYSRSARNSLFRGDSGKKIGSKRKSKLRDSNTTTFEEDFAVPQRTRTLSNGTTFEEDSLSARVAPETANTTTPHRSRGWWNVVTTPFSKTPTEGGDRNTTMSNFTGSQYSEYEPEYPPVPVPPIPGQYQQGQFHAPSPQSLGSAVFSPSDREIPIALGGDLMVAVPSPANHQKTASAQSTTSSDSGTAVNTDLNNDRMPFADVGKSPASRVDEFSPAGMVANEGNVQSSRAVVNNVTINTQNFDAQEMTAEHVQARDSHRSSLHAAVGRTVRFLTPRSSIYPPPPGQYTATRERFDPPPTPYYRKDSSNSYEEFEFEDAKYPPQKQKKQKKEKKEKKEKKDKKDKKMMGVVCLPCLGRNKASKEDNGDAENPDKKKMTRRRKCCFCCLCICITLLVLLALIIVLAVMLSKKKGASSTNTTVWVNSTSFPPMITGALTVARPNLVSSQSGCVNPSTAWSCAVPKEQQQALLPNDPNQPNLLFNIRFDNSSGLTKRSASGSANAVHFMNKRSFSPSPPAPGIDDQKFLGNTTDKNTTPFEGEATPFYISLNQPGSTGSNKPTKVKRQAKPSQSVNQIPDIATNIPLPSLNPDGTPGPANLLPFPQDQPLRLYNKGRNDEHYGFYTYFERNIFLRSGSVRNMTGDIVSSDLNGGSTQDGANVRCTWKDTRLLVQIWTKRGNGQLLSHATAGSNLQGGDFKRPGTFPYPVTFTLDRHGGGLNTKMLFCYDLDEKGRVITDQRSFLGEDRAFGGTAVNPSTGPFSSSVPKVTIAEGGPGGIDGGTGGCGCSWQNWS
jgi:hypothetical protein